ncbi:hypothetical protein ACH492_22345 [Streptomyces sp. NPDC019443]|uniref:hypothetical protein n=1 Tax=Streptomyces sp. NPDC019443 TaxID=3365061 RepID=UPI00379DA240
MATATRTAPHHDKLTCVKHYGCLRPECRDRYKAYQRDRYHSRTAGTWQPLIDAEPVRLHLLALYAVDFTPVRVSELSGLPFETVIGFTRAYGNTGYRKARKRRCTPEVAAKILAITPDTAMPGVVDATGTSRRIQALVAAGWPMKYLGPRFGCSERTAGSLIGQDRVYGRTAQAVADVYEQLAGEKPQKHGISPRSASRARIHAARRRWATVAYWAGRPDAIDDPHFTPDYGITRAEIVAEEAHWLITTAGLTRTAVAERLGIARCYVDRALAEHPQLAA